jgi:hypothetical protein
VIDEREKHFEDSDFVMNGVRDGQARILTWKLEQIKNVETCSQICINGICIKKIDICWKLSPLKTNQTS